MKKIAILSILLIAVFAGCKKDNLAGNEITGEGLVDFALKTPSSGTNLVLNAALPNQTVDITWNPAKPGLSTLPTYNWVAVKKGTTFESPLVSIPSNNNGKDAKLTLTYKKIDDALKAKGVADGAKIDLVWAVMANNGSTKIMSQNTFNLSITRFSDGATPFILLAPVSSDASVTINPTSTSDKFVFRWTKSLPKAGGSPIVYKVLFSATSNFETPLFTLKADAAPADTMRTISFKALSDSLSANGLTNASTTLKWTVVATSGTWKQQADYVNTIAILRASDLYIVGDATPGGWANPVPTPSQQFTKVDPTTFSLTIQLTAGKSYLFLPLNGDWGHKYGGATDGTAPGGGTLLADGAVPGSNTPSPATTGFYKIVVNFQTNKYTVTPVALPSNLYIVGDATPGGWSNPVPTPSQQFTKLDNVTFAIVVNLTAGNSYLFLPVNGDWSHKFGGASDGTASGGGALLSDGDVPGSNTPAPSTTGLYRIVVNFGTNTYTVTPVPSSLFIVGDATPGGWNNPVPVPSQQFTQSAPGLFTLSIPLTTSKSYLLLPVNGDWSHKFGGATDGTATGGGDLLADGDVPGSNTPAPATSGTYTMTVDFTTMKYKVQ